MKAGIVLLAVLLAGCNNIPDGAPPNEVPQTVKRVFYSTPDEYITIWVDPDTGCHYLVYRVPGTAGSITPRLNYGNMIVCSLTE